MAQERSMRHGSAQADLHCGRLRLAGIRSNHGHGVRRHHLSRKIHKE